MASWAEPGSFKMHPRLIFSLGGKLGGLETLTLSLMGGGEKDGSNSRTSNVGDFSVLSYLDGPGAVAKSGNDTRITEAWDAPRLVSR